MPRGARVLLYCCYSVVAVLQCLPLWPENSAGKLCVRVVGSESTSKFFYFNRQDNGTLLSLNMVSVSAGTITWADFTLRAQYISGLFTYVCVCVFSVVGSSWTSTSPISPPSLASVITMKEQLQPCCSTTHLGSPSATGRGQRSTHTCMFQFSLSGAPWV